MATFASETDGGTYSLTLWLASFCATALNSAQAILKARIVPCSSILTHAPTFTKEFGGRDSCGHRRIHAPEWCRRLLRMTNQRFPSRGLPDSATLPWLTVARFGKSTIVCRGGEFFWLQSSRHFSFPAVAGPSICKCPIADNQEYFLPCYNTNICNKCNTKHLSLQKARTIALVAFY